MEITDLSPIENKKRFDLYIDHQLKGDIGLGVVAKFNLYVGREIHEEELEDVFLEDAVIEITDKLAHLLTANLKPTAYARKKIREFLKKRGLNEDLNVKVEDIVLSRLIEYGFLNDEEYTRLFLISRIQNKPRSLFMIKQELRAKGIDQDVIEKVFSKETTSDRDLVVKLLMKKFKYKNPLDLKDKKLLSFLQRKGFSWDNIKQGIEKYNERFN